MVEWRVIGETSMNTTCPVCQTYLCLEKGRIAGEISFSTRCHGCGAFIEVKNYEPALAHKLIGNISKGKKIEAIKIYRTITEAGLKEAKLMIEGMMEAIEKLYVPRTESFEDPEE